MQVHFAEDTASNDSGSIESADLVKKPLPGKLIFVSLSACPMSTFSLFFTISRPAVTIGPDGGDRFPTR